jgi:hypothetical protein
VGREDAGSLWVVHFLSSDGFGMWRLSWLCGFKKELGK